jgi:hypothetical protein
MQAEGTPSSAPSARSSTSRGASRDPERLTTSESIVRENWRQRVYSFLITDLFLVSDDPSGAEIGLHGNAGRMLVPYSCEPANTVCISIAASISALNSARAMGGVYHVADASPAATALRTDETVIPGDRG